MSTGADNIVVPLSCEWDRLVETPFAAHAPLSGGSQWQIWQIGVQFSSKMSF